MVKSKQTFGEYKCKICSKVFSERAGLTHHVQLHTTDRPFSCKMCTYTCKTKKYLHKHIGSVHRRATKNECEMCGKKFHYKCQLDKHMYVHTNERPFKCEVCDKGFNSTYSLSSHMHLHTGAKPYKCSFCDYACRDNSTLRKHQERHTGITRLYQCTACQKSYKTKRVLKAHVAEVHMELDVKTKPCAECGKMFKTIKQLNNHVRQTHLRLYSCKCDICGVTLSSKYNMMTHLTTHIDYRPFTCSFEGCSKRYKDKGALKKHTIVHYPEKHFVCDICDKKFTRLYRMYEHKKQHQAKRKCVFCDYCGKGFYNKNYVRSHITRKHMYRQCYICDVCGLRTYNKPSIVMHLKYGHASEMDRKCKICKKTYKKHLYLKAHYWNTHCIRYKLNNHRSRVRKLKKRMNETADEPSNSNDVPLAHKIKIEALSDTEEMRESTEYSKGILSEDVKRGKSENTTSAGSAEKKFADFFIEHIIMPSSSREETIRNETDVYVDVTCQKEAERVRREMLKRWRQNGGVGPMRRLKRHYNGVIKKKDFSKVINEKIEITVFSETEANVPISEYKLKRNSVKESIVANGSNDIDKVTKNNMNARNDTVSDHDISKTNHLSPKIDEQMNSDSERINNNQNESINDVNKETGNHINDEIEKISDIVKENQDISSKIDDNINKENEINDNQPSIGEENRQVHVANAKNDETVSGEATSTQNDECGKNYSADVRRDNLENSIQEEIQLNAGEKDGIGFENSLAELVKVRKRKCVRNAKNISYADVDEISNSEIISKATKNNENSTNDEMKNNNFEKIELVESKRKPKKTQCNRNVKKRVNKNCKQKSLVIMEGKASIENDESNSRESDKININNNLDEASTVKQKRRCVRKNTQVNTNLNSHNDGGDDDDDDQDFVPDDENNKSNKFKINTHQCYVCFKLYETKEKLLDHCKEHFDVCNLKMLKKCPLCDFVTHSDLVKHVRLTHKINFNYLYGTLKDRKNNNTKSRFYFNANNDKVNEVEVIPSIKNLNRQAFLKIDKKRREDNDKEIRKTKLVKKDGEWIVEKVLINTKKGNYVLPDKIKEMLKNNKGDDKNNGKRLINDDEELENCDYLVKMQKLSHIAKKNGQNMLFPCEKCEKICQTFSALKLHSRRHDPNAKPFRKKVWKHKLSEDELNRLQEIKEKEKNTLVKNKNRYEKPKPIVHKHKCDPKLKDFYEKNIKGGDIEFWQFLKIFNKMTRENVNNFTDLENRTEFGNHFNDPALNPPKESVTSKAKTDSNKAILVRSKANKGVKPKKVVDNKVRNCENRFKRTILISRKEYIKRKRMIELLRKKANEPSNI